MPYPPGALTDIIPRMVAERLRETWGQPVVVDNRVGAGGNLGADLVAKSAPNGYTLSLSARQLFGVTIEQRGQLQPVSRFKHKFGGVNFGAARHS